MIVSFALSSGVGVAMAEVWVSVAVMQTYHLDLKLSDLEWASGRKSVSVSVSDVQLEHCPSRSPAWHLSIDYQSYLVQRFLLLLVPSIQIAVQIQS